MKGRVRSELAAIKAHDALEQEHLLAALEWVESGRHCSGSAGPLRHRKYDLVFSPRCAFRYLDVHTSNPNDDFLETLRAVIHHPKRNARFGDMAIRN
jgi:hypothetical protein